MLWHSLGMLRGSSDTSVVKLKLPSIIAPYFHPFTITLAWKAAQVWRLPGVFQSLLQKPRKISQRTSKLQVVKTYSDWKHLLLISIFSPCLQFDWLSRVSADHSNTPALRKFHCNYSASPQPNDCACRAMSPSWPMCTPLGEGTVPDPVSDACLHPSDGDCPSF